MVAGARLGDAVARGEGPATRTGDSDPVSILQATAMARRVRRGWRSGPLRPPQLAHFAGLCGKGMAGGDAAAARGVQVLAAHRRRRGQQLALRH